MSATPMTIDFRQVPEHAMGPSGVTRGGWESTGDPRPTTADGRLLTPKQVRARARRRYLRQMNNARPVISEAEFNAIYKPIEEWDLEELARGRPRHPTGGFRGPKPKWITMEVHEKAMEQFKAAVKTEMGAQTIEALTVFQRMLASDDLDKRGRPVVPPSVKVQVAQFLIEHVVGKPKQHIESDISVRLQGILGAALVNPNDAMAPVDHGGRPELSPGGAGYSVAHLPGHTIPMGGPVVPGEGEWHDEEDDLEPQE